LGDFGSSGADSALKREQMVGAGHQTDREIDLKITK
jgi:hypothetical protein